MKSYNPLQYLAIDIANNNDLDKLTFDERIQWVKDNQDNLEALVPTDPKIKYLYVKAVSAFRKAQQGIPTNHIMSLDCTNSGVQLLALLGKCKKSAMTCNIINTGKREDLYGAILSNIEHFDHCTGITRQHIKDAIIPMLYGSQASPKQLFGEDTPELEAFTNAVNKEVPALNDTADLLRGCWNTDVNMFTMPDGHVVRLVNTTMKSIDISINEHKIGFQYEELSEVKDSTSILANVVHATDGYITREMVRMANKQGFQLAHIHDSYFSSPVNMDKIRMNFLVICEKLARSNLLEDIMEQLSGEKPELIYDDPDLYKYVLNAEFALS